MKTTGHYNFYKHSFVLLRIFVAAY